ncbi:hypothetical protein MRX96_021179 [Rhipicephalus microplus]
MSSAAWDACMPEGRPSSPRMKNPAEALAGGATVVSSAAPPRPPSSVSAESLFASCIHASVFRRLYEEEQRRVRDQPAVGLDPAIAPRGADTTRACFTPLEL